MASIFGYRNEHEPAYQLLRRFADYEVRKYEPQLRAMVEMDSVNSAFRSLAGYIFGGSTRKADGKPEPIEMTAPVAMSQSRVPGEKIEMTAPVAMNGACV